MDFFQDGPELSNTYVADPILQSHLQRVLPPEVRAAVEPALLALGDRAVEELEALAQQAEREHPVVEHYDAWGRRTDTITCSPAWTRLHEVQAELGLAAIPYEGAHGEHARVVQMAFAHLYGPSSATYTCPVSMTDAAARVLQDAAPAEVRDRVVPHLTSRAAQAWTSGQWMTEKPGGSDVGRTETVARPLPDGGWSLTGVKWFTSATTANCALALARTADGDGRVVEGSRGLGLYLVELVDPRDGRRQVGDTIRVRRLKDKLGTKSLPTAELDLDGAYATAIGDPHRGVKTIAGMLNVTRLWNAYGAVQAQARGVQMAVSYGGRREAFGRPLLALPLHRRTIADLLVDYEGSLALVVRAALLMGRVEAGTATAEEGLALRGMMPVVKLLTARTAVAATSEVVESFGGAGYIEDTGVPALLRNTQVLSIWEGTTNVLSLDLLRAAVREGALSAVLADAADRLAAADAPALSEAPALVEAVRVVADQLRELVDAAQAFADVDPADVEAGMRTYAIRLGHALSAALLAEHAAHRIATDDDHRGAAVLSRYVLRHLGGREPVMPGAQTRATTDAILAAVGA